jgi:hypothetical protein
MAIATVTAPTAKNLTVMPKPTTKKTKKRSARKISMKDLYRILDTMSLAELDQLKGRLARGAQYGPIRSAISGLPDDVKDKIYELADRFVDLDQEEAEPREIIEAGYELSCALRNDSTNSKWLERKFEAIRKARA